ncbi:proteasome (prosome, macropain) inhibitor subunit 1, isoform CRA_b, partial [Mus musculus]
RVSTFPRRCGQSRKRRRHQKASLPLAVPLLLGGAAFCIVPSFSSFPTEAANIHGGSRGSLRVGRSIHELPAGRTRLLPALGSGDKRLLCLGHGRPGPIRTVRSFGLRSDLELSHLSMSSGRRLVQTVLRGSSHLPLPERWTHSRFPHTVLILAGSLLGVIP